MDGQKLNQDPSLGVTRLTDPSADMFAASRILHLFCVNRRLMGKAKMLDSFTCTIFKFKQQVLYTK